MFHTVRAGEGFEVKAYQIDSFGIDGLVQKELPTPAPSPCQVLVEVRAASLNFRDLLMIRGVYDQRMPLPLTPLSDGAGEVIAVGSEVERLKVGDRVAGAFFQSWIDGPFSREKSKRALGGPEPGLLASHVLLDELGAVPIPSSLSYEEASTLPCAGVTAWNALFGERSVTPGEWVLVQGTGGVSMFALQLAVAAGAKVVVTSSSDEKLERAKALGAAETINYHTIPHWGAEARKRTGGGVDFVVEVGGSGTMRESLDAVKVGGHVMVIGVLAGALGEIPTTVILHKAIHIRGIYVGSVAMFQAMNQAIEANRIRPIIGQVFDYDAAPQAIRLMESAGHFGKIVIAI